MRPSAPPPRPAATAAAAAKDQAHAPQLQNHISSGNFAHGHRSMVILADRHRSILNLLMDTTLLRLFAGGHRKK
jgi:hypothetical protein